MSYELILGDCLEKLKGLQGEVADGAKACGQRVALSKIYRRKVFKRIILFFIRKRFIFFFFKLNLRIKV